MMSKEFKRFDGAMMTIRLAPETLDALRGIAYRLNVDPDDAIRQAIENWIKDCQNEIDKYKDYSDKFNKIKNQMEQEGEI